MDLIAQIDDHWAARVQREKFQFHNAQWLDIIQRQQQQRGQQHQRDMQFHHLRGNGGDEDDPHGSSGGSGGHLLSGLDDLEELASLYGVFF